MEKKEFITLITEPAKYIMKKYNILASLTAAQAILESGYGESESYKLANNIFLIKGEYKGNFIELEIPEINKDNIEELKLVKLKKYESIKECLEDRTNSLLNIKLNKKEYRYRNIVNVKDYKEVCKIMQKNGYSQVENYSDVLIDIIEQNELYKIDIEVFENKNNETVNDISTDIAKKHIIDVKNNIIAKEDQYRVRVSPNAVYDQKGVFLSKEDAIEECNKHIGYNVYTTNGMLIHESTAKLPINNKPSINNVVFIKGMKINIIDTPIYSSSIPNSSIKYNIFTGSYYIYDGVAFGSRYRITSKLEYVGKGSEYIIGFIDKNTVKLK